MLCGTGVNPPGYALGVDEATTSGYGLFELGRRSLILSGVVHGEAETAALVKRIAELVDIRTLLVALEDHRFLPAKADPTAITAHDRTVRHNKKLIALGHSKGAWSMALTMVGHPLEQRLPVAPRTWRRVMGTRVNLSRDAWKAQARMFASAIVGKPVTNSDRAEGIGIGLWCSWDGLYQWASLMRLRDRGVLPTSNARAFDRQRGVRK